MRIAYADPPYIGQAKRHYRDDPRCAEVDHAALIADLEREYDGWALSASSPSLRLILPLCPDGVRIGAWVKPYAVFRPGIRPAYAWEPVIFKPARKGGYPSVPDWVSCNISRTRGVHGAKPEMFCYWLFDVMNARPGDDFADLFPGSGAVSRAWKKWSRQPSIWREGA